jgi:DNA-binding response OmpR family regulator
MPAVRDPSLRYRPCLLVAHPDVTYLADAVRRFRRLGWDVYPAQAGPELRRLARMLEPDLVVLDVDLDGESGWLTCAKLTRERPAGRVLLIADDGEGCREKATFVGASAVVPRQGGLNGLVQASWLPPAAATAAG